MLRKRFEAKFWSHFSTWSVLLLPVLIFGSPGSRAENVILFIGDGMGFEQVHAARCFQGTLLAFEEMPYQAQMTTHSADNSVTDSAASGTAMATGAKVNNYVVSMAIPGDGSELETTLEFYKARGRKTGLITTTYLTHATPATFGAHATDRNFTSEIGQDYLNQTRPNILFGGGGNGLTPDSSRSAGYLVATDLEGFSGLTMDSSTKHLSAQFGTSFMPYEYDHPYDQYPYPRLSEMVAKAIEVLQDDPNGFFLMVEGGMIDQACHANHLERSIHETIEFARAVQVALDWAQNRGDTLIIVTADHETGGLTVTKDNGAGQYPTVTWSSTGHTSRNVPVYAWGPGAGRVTGTLDNTDIYRLCTGQPIPLKVALVPSGSDWRYEASGTDLGTAWRELDYDDTAWPYGTAKLGYGDGDEVTVIPKTSPVYPTYYFRHIFTIDTPGAYDGLSLRILRDDGAVVYLNGTEVARYNMPSGEITYHTWASTASDFPWDPPVLIPNYLMAGENIIAVEVHQANSTSSDLALDLELTAVRTEPDDVPPVLTDIEVAVTDVTALVTWTTDEPADSRIDYGTTQGSPDLLAGDSALVTKHSILLTGLAPATTYWFEISSADAWGNVTTLPPSAFATLEYYNHLPVANPDSAATRQGVAVTIDVLANDTDANNDPLTVTAVTQGTGGSVRLNSDQTVTYSPHADFSGADSFTYTISDGELTAVGQVTITVTPNTLFYDGFESGNFSVGGWVVSGPLGVETGAAYSGTYGALLKKTSAITKSLDSVGPGTLHFSYARRTANLKPGRSGQAEISADGQIWTLIDSVTGTTAWEHKIHTITLTGPDLHLRFRVNGSEGNNVFMVDEVEVRAEVALNTPPVAVDDAYTIDQDGELSVEAPGVLSNDSDPDGGPILVSWSTSPANGTLTLYENGSFTYIPDPGFNGTDTFTYAVTDGQAESVSATVTIHVKPVNNSPVNNPPVADAQSVELEQGTSIAITLAGSDPDGDPLTYMVTGNSSHGTLSGTAPNLTYTPDEGYVGSDSFTFTVNDGELSSVPATVSITVREQGVNTMHVHSILVLSQDVGKGLKRGYAEVVILDALGNPVSDANVTGEFSGGITEALTESTDAGGKAVFWTSTAVSGRAPRLVFTVIDVTLAGWTYDPESNVETWDKNY